MAFAQCQLHQNLQVTAFFLQERTPWGVLPSPSINARGISNARWWKARLLTSFCCDSSVFVSADSRLWDADFLKSFRILHSSYKRRYCLRLCPHLHFLGAKIVEMNFLSILKISFDFKERSVMCFSFVTSQHRKQLPRVWHLLTRLSL